MARKTKLIQLWHHGLGWKKVCKEFLISLLFLPIEKIILLLIADLELHDDMEVQDRKNIEEMKDSAPMPLIYQEG